MSRINYRERGWRPGIRGHPVRRGEKYKVVNLNSWVDSNPSVDTPKLGALHSVEYLCDGEYNQSPFDIRLYDEGGLYVWITDNQAVPLPKNNKLEGQD